MYTFYKFKKKSFYFIFKFLNGRDGDGLDVTSRMIDVVVVVEKVIDCLW
jgi:hypothetical protein